MLYIKHIVKLFRNKNLYLVIISLITSYHVTNYLTLHNTRPIKKAIIFVPGIFNCGLFKRDKYTNIYKNMFFNSIDEMHDTIKSVNIFQEKCNIIKCLPSGIPYKKSIQPIHTSQIPYVQPLEDKETAKYGISNIFKNIIINLKKVMKKNDQQCKVYMFNYDWRLGIKTNGEKLAEEIQQYDQVIIVAYSLGGLVTSYSFTELSKKDKIHKIKGFIACGVPFLGSSDAIYYLKDSISFNEYGLIKRLGLKMYVPYKNIQKLQKTLKNYQSVYDLLPHSILSNTETCKNLFSEPNWEKKYYENAINAYNTIYKNNKLFKWWEVIDNIYIIYGTGYKTKSKFIMSDKHNILYATENGDGTVAKSSAYPEFLAQYTKGVYQDTQTIHSDLLTNIDVQKQIINNIKEILKIETKKTKK